MNVSEAIRWLLARAAERGVELEVLATRAAALRVEAKEGKASDIHNSSQGGVGLRVVADGRVGYAYSEDLSEPALSWALDEAVENASLQAPGAALLPQGADLGRSDLLSEGLSAPLEDKAAAAIQLERALAADARVQAVQFARYMENEREVEIGSTRGLAGGYRSGTPLLLTGIVMREGDSVKQGYRFEIKPDFHQLDPGRTAQVTLEKLGRQLGARPLSTGRRRAVLEPEVVAGLLALLVYSLSGKSLAERKSRLEGKLGAQIASELVTLFDDPSVADGVANRPFDAEGTPSRRLAVIESGVLRTFLHNTDTARRTGQTTTGHASRSYSGVLQVAPTNLILQPGAGIPEGDGILLTDLMGLHAGANPITGDVSLQAMGMEMSGGELSPVDDFAVSFNLFDLLLDIDAVGDDPEWVFTMGTAMKVPSLAVPDLSFAGS